MKRELKDWWAAAATSKRTDDDSREEFADFLTEKYMCQKFDLLPPSEPVSRATVTVNAFHSYKCLFFFKNEYLLSYL